MLRILTAAVAAIVLTASPAGAAVDRVNAALSAVAWNAKDVDTGEVFVLCDVYVLDFGDDPYVSLACFGDEGYGKAWVRVKVPDVEGEVRSVRAATSGDCSGKDIAWKKKRGNVLVTISIHAEADCEVRTIRVRSS